MANERPRRFTAEQDRDFFSQLLEDHPSDNVTSSDSDWSGEEENDLVVLVVIGLILALDLLPVGNLRQQLTIALSHLGLALM